MKLRKNHHEWRLSLNWDPRDIPLLVWSLTVGVSTGLLAALFYAGIDRAEQWRQQVHDLTAGLPVPGLLLTVVVAIVAVCLSLWLVRVLAPAAAGSGIQEIEGALDGIRDLDWKRALPAKFFGGLLSIGSGLVLGREGPTIHMGGMLGRIFSQWSHTSRDHPHMLVAAGAGAGLAAAFNAPLAGILFVIEEMRSQFRYNFISVLSLSLATVSAVTTVVAIRGAGADIPMARFGCPPPHCLIHFVMLGGLFGIIGVAFNAALVASLDLFDRLGKRSFLLKGVLAGAVIGLLVWFFPDATGSGLAVIERGVQGGYSLQLLLLIFVARFGLTMFSYGSGVPGGIFFPMLTLGTLFGLLFGNAGQEYFSGFSSDPAVFAIGGMSALFTATVQAPLTGIVLVVEMTGNYELILPLMATCLTASFVAYVLGGKPIYSLLLARTLARENRTGAREDTPGRPA